MGRRLRIVNPHFPDQPGAVFLCDLDELALLVIDGDDSLWSFVFLLLYPPEFAGFGFGQAWLRGNHLVLEVSELAQGDNAVSIMKGVWP